MLEARGRAASCRGRQVAASECERCSCAHADPPDDGGQLIASVEINPYGDFTELLAHELEHVIEQLDGIDLAAKATVARSGVRNCADGTFETSRAVRVGALVALEARRER